MYNKFIPENISEELWWSMLSDMIRNMYLLLN